MFTFFVQNIDGTGLPDALHSSVIVPPFRAVNCPVCGTALTLGGTRKNKNSQLVCSFRDSQLLFSL